MKLTKPRRRGKSASYFATIVVAAAVAASAANAGSEGSRSVRPAVGLLRGEELIGFGEFFKQSPQLRLTCLSSFYLSAQQPHDGRYAKSGRYFSTAVVSRRFHEASLSCF